jgi:hypothetical protein
MKFFSDIMSETSGGKYSSKKLWGHIYAILVAITFVMDGFNFYEMDHHLFDALLIASGYYLGLRTLSKMISRTPSETKRNGSKK